MILVMSNTGEFSPILHKVQQEGGQGVIYLHNPRYRENYDGILEKVKLTQLKMAHKKADKVIFDITRPNERYRSDPDPEMIKRDAALLTMFGLKSSERSVFGPVADVMKQDSDVIGCSRFSEDAELDRMLGFKIAKQIGLKVPESHEFQNFKEGVKFLEAHQQDLWICKPQENEGFTYMESWEGELLAKMQGEWLEKCKKPWPFILQKLLPKTSVEIDFEGFFDGRRFTRTTYTMEEKFFQTGSWSMQIGCQNTIVWGNQFPGLLSNALEKMIPFLLAAKHKGWVNITAMVNSDTKAIEWLEATFRAGYDAIFANLALAEDTITNLIYSDFRGRFKDGYAAAERITIPPFPYSNPEMLKKIAAGVEIKNDMDRTLWFWMEDVKKTKDGRLVCAGADGILGVVTHVGKTIEEAANGVYAKVKRLKIAAKIQLRTDLGKRAQRHIPRLKEWGFQAR